MAESLKTVVPIIVRWALKFGAGWLAAQGISQGAAEEVAIGIGLFLIGVVISLFQRKKDLATPPPENG